MRWFLYEDLGSDQSQDEVEISEFNDVWQVKKPGSSDKQQVPVPDTNNYRLWHGTSREMKTQVSINTQGQIIKETQNSWNQ